jgi:hypothetical protein
MTEWEVKLYRYGVRLTYDITIPEPGSYLLKLYRQIKYFDDELSKPFVPISINEITPESYANVQSRYGVLLEPPPQPIALNVSATTTYGGENNTRVANTILLTIQDGYELDPLSIRVDTPIEAWKEWRSGDVPDIQTSRTLMNSTDNDVGWNKVQ